MTLDVFHSTGMGGKANVSRGVPRFQEILNLTKNTKTPSIVIHLKPSEFKNMVVKDGSTV